MIELWQKQTADLPVDEFRKVEPFEVLSELDSLFDSKQLFKGDRKRWNTKRAKNARRQREPQNRGLAPRSICHRFKTRIIIQLAQIKMSDSINLFGTYLRNLRIFTDLKKLGFDYLVNPSTGELHRIQGGTLSGSHNLTFADLENFVGLTNLDSIPIHIYFDGTPIPVYDLFTGELVAEYPLNKCKHCYPELR